MAARHDVKDLGMAAVKLPDGQQLELPLLQVFRKMHMQFSFYRCVNRKLTQRAICIQDAAGNKFLDVRKLQPT